MKPKTASFRIKADILTQAKIQAALKGMTISAWIEKQIKKGLKGHGSCK